MALSEEDLIQVREELEDAGYIRRKGPPGKKEESLPGPITTELRTATIFMSGKIIFRTMN